MIKYTITTECEDEFEISAITNAVKNKLALSELYTEVFRPVIKYSEDEKLVESYEIVWKRVVEYLEENDVKY
jgi:plasmid replication initiation protein